MKSYQKIIMNHILMSGDINRDKNHVKQRPNRTVIVDEVHQITVQSHLFDMQHDDSGSEISDADFEMKSYIGG